MASQHGHQRAERQPGGCRLALRYSQPTHMGLIPDDVIEEIRARADIVAVIGRHVELRKAGRNHKGLCPFHHEKTPSFNVSSDKQFFYCFGCHKKGDVFTFVMEYEGRSFHEAAESLAGMLGIAIPERQESPLVQRQRSERTTMLAINKLACRFFRETLLDAQRGAEGRRYLEQRGINASTAETFQLGLAPEEWSALGEFLAAQRAPMDIAVKLGLIAPRQRAGGFYDRFRGRLMCPVIVPGGEIAGFSGRRIRDDVDDEKAGAKYINSPESPVYKKSKLLFGLHQAREAFRRAGRAILVEGNFDVIGLHQAGFDETVAPLGTALTQEQVELLQRLSGKVVLLYDGDRAGRAATDKSFDVEALHKLASSDSKVRVARLPAGEDPDSIVARGGRDALAAILDRAQTDLDYFMTEMLFPGGRSVDDQAAALARAVDFIREVDNPIKRDLMIGRLAAAMGIDPALIRKALSRPAQTSTQAPHPAVSGGPSRREPPVQHPAPGNRFSMPQNLPSAIPTTASAGVPRQVQPPRPLPHDELQLLAIIADHPQLMETAEELDVFSLLTDARLRDMYCAARQGTTMLAAAPDELSPLIAKHVLAGAYATVSDPKHCLFEAVTRLRHTHRRQQLIELQKQAEDAKRRGDVALERQLVREILTTRRQVD